MIRLIVCMSLAWCISVAPSWAGDDDPKFGKPRKEWIAMLKTHEKAKFRQAALIVMETYGHEKPGIVPAVIYALENDKSVSIRRAAAQLLGRMGSDAKGAAVALGEALLNMKQDGSVREAAASALSQVMIDTAGGEPKFIERTQPQVLALTKALEDPHPDTRTAAAETILALRDKAKVALPQLHKLIADEKAPRFAQIYALEFISLYDVADKSVPVLRKVMRDEKQHLSVRETATRGLGKIGKDAAPALADLAIVIRDDKETTMRREAIIAANKIGDKAVTIWPSIESAFMDKDATIRIQAVRLAGRFAKIKAKAVELLIAVCTKDQATENRLAAIQELGKLGQNAGATALKTLTMLSETDPQFTIREAAKAAMQKIKGK